MLNNIDGFRITFETNVINFKLLNEVEKNRFIS